MADDNSYTKEPIPGKEPAFQGPGYTREPISSPSSSRYTREPYQSSSAPANTAPAPRLSTGDVVKGVASHIYHSFADEPTDEEKAQHANSEKQNNEAPGSETSGLKRIGLGLKRMTGADDSTLHRAASGAWEGLGNTAAALYGVGKDLISEKTPVLLSDEPQDQGSISKRVQGNTLINKYLLDPARAEDQKAKTAQSDLESVGHSIASMLPIIGPIAAHIGERAGTGDVAGAAGEGATYVAAPKLVEEVAPKILKGVVRAKARIPLLVDLLNNLEENKNTTSAPEAGPKTAPVFTSKTPTPKLVDELGMTSKQSSALGRLRDAHLSDLEKSAAESSEATSEPLVTEKPGNLKTLKVKGGQVVDTDPHNLQQMIEDGLKHEKPMASKGLGQVGKPPSPLGEIKTPSAPNAPKTSAVERTQEAAEAEPSVVEQVNALRDQKIIKLARAHGIDPDEYDLAKRDENRHRVERDQLAKGIVSRMSNDEVQNISRNASDLKHKPETSNWHKADRAEKVFPRLRGPVDQYGNPTVSGGSQGVNVSPFSSPELLPTKQEGIPTTQTPAQLLKRWGVTGDSLRDTDSQVRGMTQEKSHAHINKLADSYKRGSTIEPVIEYRDADNNITHVDGRHRALAAQKAGVSRVPVVVKSVQ